MRSIPVYKATLCSEKNGWPQVQVSPDICAGAIDFPAVTKKFRLSFFEPDSIFIYSFFGGDNMNTALSTKEHLELLRKSATCLDRFTDPGMPSKLLHFRPSLEDAWTVQEHLVHIFDVQVILYLWIRMAIAEPGSKVWDLGPFMHGDWMIPVGYSSQPLTSTIEAYKRIQSITYHLLKSMEDRDWSNFFVLFPSGKKWTLDDMLRILSRHADGHLGDYIKRNETLWREQKEE